MGCTCGGTDGHIAVNIISTSCGKQTGGVRTILFLSGQIALGVPLGNSLYKCTVLLVVEQEVVAGSAGVRRTLLFTHGDEPVSLGVIAQRYAIGVDFLDLCANLLQLVPGGGNTQTVCLKEGLVVVQNLGGLGERHGVHQTVTKLLTFLIVTLDEVVLLCLGQTNDLGGAVCTGNLDLAVDQGVQRHNCLSKVVQSHMVRIAVSDVGLVANGDLGGDGVTHVIVTANLGGNDGDVGVDLVELFDVCVEYVGEVATHGVVERDGDFASVVTTLRHFEIGLSCIGSTVTAAHCDNAYEHDADKKHRQKLFHNFCSFFLLFFIFLPFI